MRGVHVLKDFDFVSKATIDRMPLYYRFLNDVQREGLEIISSEELGRRIGITPEQIRKDLSSFGEFGKKGVGYYVGELKRNIGEILGLNISWNVAIIGIGHLGWALAHHKNFAKMGFRIKAIFDNDVEKLGQSISGVVVEHTDNIEHTVREKNIQIGIVTVPEEQAQRVVDRLAAGGVKGIWNFAPVKLSVPSDIYVVDEDLSVGLSSLSYYLSRKAK